LRRGGGVDVCRRDPKKSSILQLLTQREHSVGELSTLVGLSQSALSQHLSRLRRGRLVETRRDAQTIYYSSTSPAVAELLSTLEAIFPAITSQKTQPDAGSAESNLQPMFPASLAGPHNIQYQEFFVTRHQSRPWRANATRFPPAWLVPSCLQAP
jgi:DNA-binding HxlR family transcriptional regulator